MQVETETLERTDGFPLFVRTWAPDEGTPRGLVVVLHGLAEHSARYGRFAEALTGAGWAVVAPDHRGHGQSVRTEDDRGHFADEEGFLVATEDVAAVVAEARSRFPDGPCVLFGHSMGTTLATHVVVVDPSPYDALVLSGPTGAIGPMRKLGRLVAKVERLRLGRRGRSRLLHFLSFGDFNRRFKPARTAFDWLSRDPVEVDAYANDPLCGFIVTTQHWHDHLGALGLMEDATRLAAIPTSLPIHVVAGTDDPAGEYTSRITRFFGVADKAGLTRITHRFYEGARHELLNETIREEVTEDLLSWLGEVVLRG